MKYESQGFLQIGAHTASGALPAPNLTVRISGSDEENSTVNYSLVTDINGLSELLSLPAPAASYSLSPGAAEQPYAKYNIEASGDGYYKKILYDVPIFAGIKSILPLEMIPDGKMTKYISAPTSSDYATITENEDLQ